MILNISKDRFLPIYQPYINDYSNRYNVFYGGRGSGKTKFVMQKLLLKSLKEKRLTLLMRKETNKLRDSVYKELIEAIGDFQLTPYFTINKTEFRITCKLNGSEFKCLGLDEPEKIKGFADVSDVFMDEITGFNEEDFELIDGTLRSTKYQLPLQIYCCFNPISKANWVFKYFGFDTGTAPKDTFILHSTYLDNPFLDESYLKRMENMKDRNPNRWRIEALGEFCNLDKLVFNNWEIKEFNNADIKGDLIIGMDFGFVNDITAIIASIVKDDTIYVFKSWGDTNKTNKELAEIIKNMGFGKSTIVADCAEPKSIEELKREGIIRIKGCSKGKDSIIHGIQKLQNYKIVIHPSCEGVITEFENYSWKKDKKTNEYVNEPIDTFNHYIDALRYSLQIIDNDKKIKTFNKSALGL